MRIWRFNLAHELVAAAAAGLALVAGSWFIVDRLERRYLQLHRNDAERVGQLLQERLLSARRQLNRFASLPMDRQRDSAELLLPAFSDLYRLNANRDVVAVLKASEGSRVFPGFSFAGSHLDPYLQQLPATAAGSSSIDRGVEDERASVYFATTDRAGERLLARLNLSYLQDFLSRYQHSTGLPLLLVSTNGFVMLASDPNLKLPAVDLHQAVSASGLGRSVDLGHQRWFPLVTARSDFGGRMVLLLPADQLDSQRQLVISVLCMITLLVLMILAWKNRRLHQLLFQPIAQFSSQIEQLRSDLARGEVRSLSDLNLQSRFEELRQIQASFEALADAIHNRDLMLQQKLRTSLTAAAIAHEINLPLSTICLLCQQADHDRQQGLLKAEQMHQLVQALRHESQHVSGVIERMRILLRNVQTDLVATDLLLVVQGALTLLKRRFRQQQIELHCEGLNQPGLTVLGDAAQLQIALCNLLRNAVDAVAHQPPHQRRVAVHLSRQAEWAVIAVADSGQGFALAAEADVDILYQTTKASGTGMGLFVVRTCMTNHRGRMEVERSVTLGGAHVSMVLPLMATNDRILVETPALQTCDSSLS